MPDRPRRELLAKGLRGTRGRRYPITLQALRDRCYPLDWRNLAAPVGRDGAVRLPDGRGADYVHPVATAFHGLACLHRLVTGDAPDPAARCVGRVVDALLATQQPDGSWRYPVPVPRYGVRPGWSSAMAQGLGTSLLLRSADVLPGADAPRLRGAAERAVTHLLRPVDEGGCSVPDGEGRPFPEECPSEPGPFVLNGACFALLGLQDLDDRGGDGAARRAAERIDALLPRWDLGYWSRYDLLSGTPSSPDYHRLHVSLLTVLGDRYPDLRFAEFATRFEQQRRRGRQRLRALTALAVERLLLPIPGGTA